MKKLLVLWALIAMPGLLTAQKDIWKQSVRSFYIGTPDSTALLTNMAINQFKREGKKDSLLAALVFNSNVVYEKEGFATAKKYLDSLLTAYPKPIKKYDFGHSLLMASIGDMHAMAGDFDSAFWYFDKAKAVTDTTARTYQNFMLNACLAKSYMMHEQGEQAMYYLGRLEFVATPVLPAWSFLQLSGASTKIKTLITLSRPDLAMAEAQKLLDKIHREYPTAYKYIATTNADLSVIYYNLFRYEDALEYRLRSVAMFEKIGLKQNVDRNLFVAYGNLAILYYYLNEYSLALSYSLQAEEKGRKIFGEKSIRLLSPFVSRSEILLALDRPGEALNSLDKAFELQLLNEPYNWYGLGYLYSYKGDFYYNTNNYDSSIKYYKHTIHTLALDNMQNDYYSLFAKQFLALSYREKKLYKEALYLQNQVLYHFTKHYPLLIRDHILFLDEKGQTYLAMQNFPEAFCYSDSAMKLQSKQAVIPKYDHSWILEVPYSDKFCDRLLARIRIFSAHAKAANDTSSLKRIVELVTTYGQYITQNLYNLRTHESLSQQAKVNKDIFSLGADASLQLYELTKDKTYFDLLFDFIEQSKSLILRIASNNYLVDQMYTGNDPVFLRDIAFRKSISSLQTALLQADTGQDSILNLISNTTIAYRKFQDTLKVTGHPLFKKKYELKNYSIDSVQKKLINKKTAVLEFFYTSSALIGLCITSDTFYVHVVDSSINGAIRELNNPSRLTVERFKSLSFQLYQKLFLPFKALSAVSGLIIVPDGALYKLNFELIVSNNTGAHFNDLPYLIRKYNISYLLSTRVAVNLKESRAPAKKSNHSLIFSPVFTNQMKNSYKSLFGNRRNFDSTYDYLYRQPFTLATAKAIGKSIASTVFLEEDATETAFMEGAEKRNGIIYIGSHAVANDIEPLKSKIYFAKNVKEPEKDDGILNTYEIFGSSVNADLAVLSACETGLGALGSEGFISLAYSFMYAGCPSVVMSTWTIDEKSNAKITQAFYNYLSHGKTKSEALRLAKLDYLENSSESANPYYWAGLILMGDSDPIRLKTNNSRIYLFSFLIIAAIAGIFCFRRKKLTKKQDAGFPLVTH